MESVKEAERTVIVKPVASRPSCSSFRSFTDLLIDTSSPSEAVVPAIRPKTVRFKPMVNPAISTAGLTSSRAGIFSDKVSSKSDGKTAAATVVHKPLAKVVAKSTFTLLASTGNFNNKSVNKQTQAPPPPPQPRRAESTVHEASKSRQNYQSAQRDLDEDKNDDDNNDNDETNTNDKFVAASDTRASLSSSSSSYDGYNWRKYGQKQVKGSEYPRSYYKCTHPGCPVKKKVERSLDGQIAEIVYKAEHNHSKPQPAANNNNNNNKRSTTGSAASLPERTTTTANADHQACSEGVINNNKDRVSELGFACSSYNCRGGSVENNNVVVEAAEEEGLMTSKGIIEGDDDQEDYDQARSSNKRRKAENNQLSSVAEAGAQECRVVVQNSSDPEVSGDGFRWRKYGQKVVKGNPYPRSYYRCTGLKCNVRKHVERASDDPKAFITTYEGKHNHEMPIKNPNNINNNYSHSD